MPGLTPLLRLTPSAAGIITAVQVVLFMKEEMKDVTGMTQSRILLRLPPAIRWMTSLRWSSTPPFIRAPESTKIEARMMMISLEKPENASLDGQDAGQHQDHQQDQGRHIDGDPLEGEDHDDGGQQGQDEEDGEGHAGQSLSRWTSGGKTLTLWLPRTSWKP